MLLKNIDFKEGKIIYDDFDIDPDLSFEEQELSFKEDLFQIDYDNKYLIDIGYYPEFDPSGQFRIYVIKGCDWENPLFIKNCKTFNKLLLNLQEAIDYVQKLNKKGVSKYGKQYIKSKI